MSFVFSALALVACGSSPGDTSDPSTSSAVQNGGDKSSGDTNGGGGDTVGGDSIGKPKPPKCDLKCPDHLASTTVKITDFKQSAKLDDVGEVDLINSLKHQASLWKSDVDIFAIIVQNDGNKCFLDGPPDHKKGAMTGITPWSQAVSVSGLDETTMVDTPDSVMRAPDVTLTFCFEPKKKGW